MHNYSYKQNYTCRLPKLFYFFVISSFILYSCTDADDQHDDIAPPVGPVTPAINYSVVNFHLHDTSLYTEGLLFHNGQLFESTGSPDGLESARSMIGISDLKTGKFEKKIELDRSKYFGEGIVFLNNKLYQLTYHNQTGFIYDANTFKKIDTFRYGNKEGWALTTNGKELIMSDGTDALTFLDPASLKPVRTLKVTENGKARDSLNELEYIKGYIYANIWYNNNVVKIDPADGKVVGRIDFSSLAFEAVMKNPNINVLNGIAYDSTTDKIYVTGKMWSNIYEVKFTH